jgi:hypothetical protein
MVSPSESTPLLTKESAVAPLKALATLATRMWSVTRGRRPLLRLATPNRCAFRFLPRCTMAMTPGGPPRMATSSSSARSNAASALFLLSSLPKATLLPAR